MKMKDMVMIMNNKEEQLDKELENIQKGLREISKVENYLKDHNIEYEKNMIFNGIQIATKDWDVVFHKYAYGYKNGLMEACGSICRLNEDVEGWLSAKDIIKRLENNN